MYEVATDGSDLSVTVVPRGFDALLEVADQDWFFAIADEEGGAVEAVVEPTSQESVFLVVSGFGGTTGDFTIYVEP